MTPGAGAGGTRRELLIATRNVGKAVELRTLLAPLGVPVVDLREAGISPTPEEDTIEDGETFEANALAKVRYFSARSNHRPVLADDSGLCVPALDGAPGVRSRRYAGVVGSEAAVAAANSARLLEALDGVVDRRAEFVCAVAYVEDGRESVYIGRVAGRILDAPRGANGFGYDPLFWSDDLARGFGEATNIEKARVSHRARAVRALLPHLGPELRIRTSVADPSR